MKNSGAIIDVDFNFGLSLFSYNKTKFEKFGVKYKVETYIIMFIKYEVISYIKEK